MTTTRGIQKAFLQSPFFAVVGASKDQNKYGTKVWLLQIPSIVILILGVSQVLKWYTTREFNVTPIHHVRE